MSYLIARFGGESLGVSLSPGLRATNARAAAAVSFAQAEDLLTELAGLSLTTRRINRSAEADGAAADWFVAQLVDLEAGDIYLDKALHYSTPTPCVSLRLLQANSACSSAPARSRLGARP